MPVSAEFQRSGQPDATTALWGRLRRPFDVVAMVDAVLGLSPNVVRQLAGTMLATSGEAETLLTMMPHTLRSLAMSTTSSPEQCRGELRGPVLWSETMSARSSSAGSQDVYVCSSPQRAYDIPENQVLAAALVSIRDAGRGVDSMSAQSYDDDTLRRARHNGMRAIRFLEHRAMSAVTRERPSPRALKRTRSGSRRQTYEPALRMLDRAADPLTADDILPFCDRRTRAQHALIMSLVDRLEARGVELPQFRAFEGILYSGPIRYNHPRRLGDRSRPHGVMLGGVLVDVPERVREDNRERAEYALRERSGGLPTVVVLEPADVDRAIQAAVEVARAQQAEQEAS